VTEQELRDAVAYHRKVHRPYLFAPRAGPMSECGMPTCQWVMAELRHEHEHEEGDAILAALEYGDGGPAMTVVEHMAHCTDAKAALVVDGNADDIIGQLVAAGWTLSERTDRIAGKRIRFVIPPGGKLGL